MERRQFLTKLGMTLGVASLVPSSEVFAQEQPPLTIPEILTVLKMINDNSLSRDIDLLEAINALRLYSGMNTVLVPGGSGFIEVPAEEPKSDTKEAWRQDNLDILT